jgi:hypothetical protein
MELNRKQTIAKDKWQDRSTNEIIYGGGAGGGKSVILSFCLLKNALKYPGTKWLMGRANLKTLKETTLQSFFKVCYLQKVKAGTHFRYNGSSNKENPNAIEFYNGSLILLKDLFYYPSDPEFDELGSLEITGAGIDEVSQITEKAWNIVRSRIRHDVDKNNLIPKILGTCNPAKNFIYEKFYKPWRDGKLPTDKAFIQAFVTDNKDIDKYYIENLQKLDPVSRARLLEGSWEYDDDPSVLMQYEKIVDLFTNAHIALLGDDRYMTIDVARLGKDNTTIRIWEGMTSIKKMVIPKCRIDELAALIRKLQREYAVPNSNTIADEDGVGGGLVDILRCRGFVNNSKPVPINGEKKNYQNLRSQCYFELAKVVNYNQMYLPDEPVKEREIITKELEHIKQKDIDKDGKVAVIGKEIINQDIGHSPDEADNLMMRMWFVLNKNLITNSKTYKEDE